MYGPPQYEVPYLDQPKSRDVRGSLSEVPSTSVSRSVSQQVSMHGHPAKAVPVPGSGQSREQKEHSIIISQFGIELDYTVLGGPEHKLSSRSGHAVRASNADCVKEAGGELNKLDFSKQHVQDAYRDR